MRDREDDGAGVVGGWNRVLRVHEVVIDAGLSARREEVGRRRARPGWCSRLRQVGCAGAWRTLGVVCERIASLESSTALG
jgi:hypothetical protein